MDQAMIAKQITGFYKTAFDNSLNAITMIQEQTEKIINYSLEQVPCIPVEGKNIVTDLVKACRKNSDDFIAVATDQYDKFGTCLNLNKGKAAKNN